MNEEKPEEIVERLRGTARDAPRLPGVYLWKDGEGQIIYVGKAKALRDRLGSYFSGAKDLKTATLVRHARSIETIIVASEYEALLLENTLIKQHSPRYNINLKDGKSYPVIRLTAEDFPRVFRTRRIVEDGSQYFGPFPDVRKVDDMLEIVDKLFPLRKCRRLLPRKSPSMYYHIGRCRSPCCGKISKEEYAVHVRQVQQLLSGDDSALIADLTRRMEDAAGELRFEWAAKLRNAILAIKALTAEDSAVVDFDGEGRDYIAWAAEEVLATFTVFSMRGGKMTGRELFRTRSAACEEDSLEHFITSYYDPARPPPAFIYLQPLTPGTETGSAGSEASGVPDRGQLASWFKARFGFEPRMLAPAEAEKDEKRHTAVLAMARQNALEDLRKRLKERGAGPALDELARVLGLRERPQRIEGFDIAQLDGRHPVASLISFRNGVPDRKNYRHFKLRSTVGVVDDFASMREAVRRRYSRLLREGLELPDLVLIDGGIGQVNAAKSVLDELGLDCGVVGLAKREEELWLPGAGKPVILSRRSEALKVLQFVRDETHRFATGLNQRLRSGDLFLPALESVRGIGKKRAAEILRAYGGIAEIAGADPAGLAEKCRIPEDVAAAVRTAARLALEDRAAKAANLNAGRGRRPASGGFGESLAAEADPGYSPLT
ncbi:MAG: excinuclease ABC subunit UvrC [Treponema sp.]|nr:excinuclease ABC subunit UvrC [Treponema sp.]